MPQSLNGKGINDMNELDCLRSLLLRDPADGAPNAVLYTSQALTSPQKAQAASNIGLGTTDLVGFGQLAVAGNSESAFRTTAGSYVDNVLSIRNDTGDGVTTFGYSATNYIYGTSAGALAGTASGAAFGLSNANNDAFAQGGYIESYSDSTTAPPISFVQSGIYGGGAFSHVRQRFENSGVINFYGVDINATIPATATMVIAASSSTRTVRFNAGVGINIAPDTTYDLLVNGLVKFNSEVYVGSNGVILNGAGNHGAGVEIVTGGTLFATNITTLNAAKTSFWGGLGYNNTIGTFFRFYTTGTGNDFEAYCGDTGDVANWRFHSGGAEILRIDGAAILLAGKNISMGAASNIELDTATGTQLGTATGQKLGFWGHAPVVQQVLATGAARTTEDIIAFLQAVGLCKQS